MYSFGTTSTLVLKSCPSLIKVGPSAINPFFSLPASSTRLCARTSLLFFRSPSSFNKKRTKNNQISSDLRHAESFPFFAQLCCNSSDALETRGTLITGGNDSGEVVAETSRASSTTRELSSGSSFSRTESMLEEFLNALPELPPSFTAAKFARDGAWRASTDSTFLGAESSSTTDSAFTRTSLALKEETEEGSESSRDLDTSFELSAFRESLERLVLSSVPSRLG
mmetsp:Transcript_15475/g.33357  ORF Transcript_15475/g.33357 Transcript_15475/m.33357 type:complete len:225 (-) Transcript_15475:392-1066(-)